jgi:hypothetical protein
MNNNKTLFTEELNDKFPKTWEKYRYNASDIA